MSSSQINYLTKKKKKTTSVSEIFQLTITLRHTIYNILIKPYHFFLVFVCFDRREVIPRFLILVAHKYKKKERTQTTNFAISIWKKFKHFYNSTQ